MANKDDGHLPEHTNLRCTKRITNKNMQVFLLHDVNDRKLLNAKHMQAQKKKIREGMVCLSLFRDMLFFFHYNGWKFFGSCSCHREMSCEYPALFEQSLVESLVGGRSENSKSGGCVLAFYKHGLFVYVCMRCMQGIEKQKRITEKKIMSMIDFWHEFQAMGHAYDQHGLVAGNKYYTHIISALTCTSRHSRNSKRVRGCARLSLSFLKRLSTGLKTGENRLRARTVNEGDAGG